MNESEDFEEVLDDVDSDISEWKRLINDDGIIKTETY